MTPSIFFLHFSFFFFFLFFSSFFFVSFIFGLFSFSSSHKKINRKIEKGGNGEGYRFVLSDIFKTLNVLFDPNSFALQRGFFFVFSFFFFLFFSEFFFFSFSLLSFLFFSFL